MTPEETLESAVAFWQAQLRDATRFMDAVSAHALEESGEPLVDLAAAAATAGSPLVCLSDAHPTSRPRDHRLRAGNVEPLLAVAERLHEQGFVLLVEDTFRSAATQRATGSSSAVVDAFVRMLARSDEPMADDEIANGMMAVVAGTLKRAGHVAGAAIDVTVVDAAGRELDRGAPYLDFSERMPMRSPFVTREQADARAFITTTMAVHDFTAYPYEFWHYSRGDALAAVGGTSSSPARYGPVDVDVTGAVTPLERIDALLHDPVALVAAVRSRLAG